jgi:hypothetical protein
VLPHFFVHEKCVTLLAISRLPLAGSIATATDNVIWHSNRDWALLIRVNAIARPETELMY